MKHDFIIFTLLALAAFGVIHYTLWRNTNSGRLPVLVWILVATILGTGYFAVNTAEERALGNIRSMMEGIAPTYANGMENLQHWKLPDDAAPDDPFYLELIERENSWLALNPPVNDIYTMRKRADGKLIFLVDSETDYNRNGKIDEEREKRTKIGEVCVVTDEAMRETFNGKSHFNSKPIHDFWGNWVTAYVPLHDDKGKVEAILGVDFDAAAWLTAEKNARLTAMFYLGGLLSLLAIGCLTISQQNAARDLLANRREREIITSEKKKLEFLIETNKKEAANRMEELDRMVEERTSEMRAVNESYQLEIAERIAAQEAHALTGAQLLQSQKMDAVGQLAAGVAHDFNNLLTVIQGHASMHEGENLPGPVGHSFREILSASRRASDLTRQLLTFSRQNVVQERLLNMDEIFTGMGEMLLRLVPANIRLQMICEQDLPAISCDPGSMDLVLLNLVVNARDAIGQNGDIKIEARGIRFSETKPRSHADARAGHFVNLSVTDDGEGMTPEVLQRIFEPFFTTKAIGKGTGLGLATVFGVVKDHRGWMEVETEPGKGSTFHLFLPVAEQKSPILEKIAPESVVRGKSTILLVDDDPLVRSLACVVLTEAGYDVIEAEDGAEAISIAERGVQDFDLLLTDMVMPGGITGIDVANRVMELRPGLPVIYSSGYSADLFNGKVELRQEENYLPKPYLSYNLVEIVNRGLGPRDPSKTSSGTLTPA